MNEAEKKIEEQAKQSDHEDAGKDVLHPDKTLCAHHHGPDPVGRGDDFGDDEIGPTHREHLAGRVEIAGKSGWQNDPPDDIAALRPQGS